MRHKPYQSPLIKALIAQGEVLEKYGVGKPVMKRKTPLRRVSAKRARQNREYAKRRKLFLDDHRICPVVYSGVTGRAVGTYIYTTDVHHTDGRENTLLLDESKWLAVSREGHRWLHENPAESRKRGWLI